MDFFDKLSKKATEAYQATKEKTTQVSGELKLKGKINSNEDKVYQLYAQIGELAYDAFITNTELDKDTITPMFEEIKEYRDEIEKYKTEILELNNKKACVKCGAELEADAGFCTKCGAKQPEKDAPDFRVEPAAPADAKEVENEETKTDETKTKKTK